MSNLIKLHLPDGWDRNSRTNEVKAKIFLLVYSKNLRKI